MTKRHKYADVLESIARGDDVTCQYLYKDDWEDLGGSDEALVAIGKYEAVRIKPKTIVISDMEVPEPLRVEPENGAEYFYPTLGDEPFFDTYRWYDDELDRRLLKSGQVHLTKEAAIAHAKALIKVSGGRY